MVGGKLTRDLGMGARYLIGDARAPRPVAARLAPPLADLWSQCLDGRVDLVDEQIAVGDQAGTALEVCIQLQRLARQIQCLFGERTQL